MMDFSLGAEEYPQISSQGTVLDHTPPESEIELEEGEKDDVDDSDDEEDIFDLLKLDAEWRRYDFLRPMRKRLPGFIEKLKGKISKKRERMGKDSDFYQDKKSKLEKSGEDVRVDPSFVDEMEDGNEFEGENAPQELKQSGSGSESVPKIAGEGHEEQDVEHRVAEVEVKEEAVAEAPVAAQDEGEITGPEEKENGERERAEEELEGDRDIGHLSESGHDIIIGDEEHPEPLLSVGEYVEVASRTWPGINKPGGAAKVTKCVWDEEEGEHTYNVAYVLGGRETGVEVVYIKSNNHADGLDSRRRKQGLQGRCRYVSRV